MPGHERHTYDVVIIGAGGAGLRAAIEAAADGVSVAVITKTLLGKAHTVMAEGGIAAALANVDERDNWQVHFADTMRGGQYLNNWRMAQLHAQQSPDRVRELEAWGALMDRTGEGRILQRNFGGHAYPRLAHVGDRTGLEMIRTLQDHGIHQGIDVYNECTVTRLLLDGPRCAGCFGYDREKGTLRVFEAGAVILATGGIGRAFKITSNSWECTGDGHSLAYHAGADLIDMEFVQFHPTGMVWPPSAQGILVTEGVRGEGGILKNSEGRRFMFDDIPPLYQDQTADTPEEGWRYVIGDRDARRPPELLTRDHVARCIVREVKEGRGSPHGGAFLDIAWIKEKLPNAEEHIKKKLPSMYHQFKQLANVDITKERTCRACSPRVRSQPACTAPTGWAATPSRTFSCSASSLESTPRDSPGSTEPGPSTRAKSTPRREKPWPPWNANRARARDRIRFSSPCRTCFKRRPASSGRTRGSERPSGTSRISSAGRRESR
jgi:succinate dehydrogenase / fumarate reductase flavoprotein subunit